MFTDHPKCTQVQEKIFIFKKFFDEETISKVNNLMKNPDYNQSDRNKKHTLEWFGYEKETPSIPEMLEIWEALADLLYPEHVAHPQLGMMINRAGEPGMFVHNDSPGRKMCNGNDHSACEIESHDVWQTCCILDYGIIAYFGEFTGGAVYYPHIRKDGSVMEADRDDKNCFEVQPEPGDVVIHAAYHPWEHGVRDVDTGIRFSFANFVLKREENPGTFHNYKTPEYYEDVKGDLTQWVKPLVKNPLFDENGFRIIPHKK